MREGNITLNGNSTSPCIFFSAAAQKKRKESVRFSVHFNHVYGFSFEKNNYKYTIKRSESDHIVGLILHHLLLMLSSWHMFMINK